MTARASDPFPPIAQAEEKRRTEIGMKAQLVQGQLFTTPAPPGEAVLFVEAAGRDRLLHDSSINRFRGDVQEIRHTGDGEVHGRDALPSAGGTRKGRGRRSSPNVHVWTSRAGLARQRGPAAPRLGCRAKSSHPGLGSPGAHARQATCGSGSEPRSRALTSPHQPHRLSRAAEAGREPLDFPGSD